MRGTVKRCRGFLFKTLQKLDERQKTCRVHTHAHVAHTHHRVCVHVDVPLRKTSTKLCWILKCK